MPDLTTHLAWTCTQNVFFCRNVKDYLVTWDEVRRVGTKIQWDWHCTCPAYKYGRGKHCKHIEAVKAQRCTWNESMDPTCEPIECADGQRVCPDCGGPVYPMFVAV